MNNEPKPRPFQSERINPSTLEARLLRLQDEKNELMQIAQIKEKHLNDQSMELEELKERLAEDERLIESLLIYINRLKGGGAVHY